VTRTQRAPNARRKPALVLLAAAGVFLLYGILFGRHGLSRYVGLREELAARSAEAYRRVARNRAMTERLVGLRTDQRILEEVARSTLGVVHDDEIVLVFRKPRGLRRR
jgi:cell division protein FtsB